MNPASHSDPRPMDTQGHMGQPGMPPQHVQGSQQPPVQQHQLPLSCQLCKMGQETVHEIVSRTQDLFQLLRNTSPPNGTPISQQTNEDRRNKISTAIGVIQVLFRKLRKIYEKVSEATTEMEFIEIESLIPLKDDRSTSIYDDKKNSEVARKLSDEKSGYTEQLRIRNRQIKEMIDIMREFIWDINAMLAMKK